MKSFFALLLACWVLCLSVCADEIASDFSTAPVPAPVEDSASEVDYGSNVQAPAPVFSPVDPVVDVSAPTFTLDEVLAALPESLGSPDVVSENVVLTGISLVSVPPVTPSSTTGLKAALLTVLGNYDPVVVVYQYNTSSSGYSSYATDIQPDYAWIASAALLCLVIWCLFKLGGALLRG